MSFNLHKTGPQPGLQPPWSAPAYGQSFNPPPDLRGVLQAKRQSNGPASSAHDDSQPLSVRLHNVLAELSRSESRLKVLEAEVQVLKKSNSTLSVENSKLKSNQAQTSKENADIRQVMGTLEAAVTELQSRNEALETLCQQYKTQNQQRTLDTDSLQSQTSFLTKRNETLLAKCEQFKEQKETATKELEECQKTVARLTTDLGKRDKELEECMQKVVDSDTRLLHVQAERDGMQRDVIELGKVKESNETLKTDLKSLERKTGDLWNRYRVQVNRLTESTQKNTTQVERLQTQLLSTRELLEKCQVKLMEKDERIQMLLNS